MGSDPRYNQQLMRRSFIPVALLTTSVIFLTYTTTRVAGQQASADLEVIQIRPNFHVIAGDGSNIAVHLGPDGVVVVDTGSGEKAKQVVAEIRKLSTRPIRYIINTSADPDHVGGNDELSAAGESVIPTGGLNEIGAAGGRAPILAEGTSRPEWRPRKGRSRMSRSAPGRR